MNHYKGCLNSKKGLNFEKMAETFSAKKYLNPQVSTVPELFFFSYPQST